MSWVLIGAEYVFLLTAARCPAPAPALLLVLIFSAYRGFHRRGKGHISSDSVITAVCHRVAGPLHTDVTQMPDIATITINPAIDIFVNVSRVEPTRKLAPWRRSIRSAAPSANCCSGWSSAKASTAW
jgi:hypothetical protein